MTPRSHRRGARVTCTAESHDAIRATPARWAACAYVGVWEMPGTGEVYESRNCRDCGSTLERLRHGYVWCAGESAEHPRGHAVPRGNTLERLRHALDTDALGRTWCPTCATAEQSAALEDARNNDGAP